MDRKRRNILEIDGEILSVIGKINLDSFLEKKPVLTSLKYMANHGDLEVPSV
jgi:hypothetical protein